MRALGCFLPLLNEPHFSMNDHKLIYFISALPAFVFGLLCQIFPLLCFERVPFCVHFEFMIYHGNCFFLDICLRKILVSSIPKTRAVFILLKKKFMPLLIFPMMFSSVLLGFFSTVLDKCILLSFFCFSSKDQIKDNSDSDRTCFVWNIIKNYNS